jgi:hypothetical protein
LCFSLKYQEKGRVELIKELFHLTAHTRNNKKLNECIRGRNNEKMYVKQEERKTEEKEGQRKRERDRGKEIDK